MLQTHRLESSQSEPSDLSGCTAKMLSLTARLVQLGSAQLVGAEQATSSRLEPVSTVREYSVAAAPEPTTQARMRGVRRAFGVNAHQWGIMVLGPHPKEAEGSCSHLVPRLPSQHPIAPVTVIILFCAARA